MNAELSQHFQTRAPSPIREAQILFARRPDQVRVINLAIGDVTRPMHPAMRLRMEALGREGSPFAGGVVGYSESAGRQEARDAFLNVIASCGLDSSSLHCLVTDGGSQAMEMMILGTCGPGSSRPLMLIEPAYTNYMDMARRLGVPTISVRRTLGADGRFSALDPVRLEALIREHSPGALVVIPADNPTGQSMSMLELGWVAKLAVRYGLWLVSDEAYRQLHYGDSELSTIWALCEHDVPGIGGSRIGIESASKVFNACGLRIGALVTDCERFHHQAVAEYTANLSANALGQHIFGALAHVSHEALHRWYAEQREHYAGMMQSTLEGLRGELPDLIAALPRASLYAVIDVRRIVPDGFLASEFIRYCAERGRTGIEGQDYTLLVAPMEGFYAEPGIGQTQMRLAFVASPGEMRLVPRLFRELLEAYLAGARKPLAVPHIS